MDRDDDGDLFRGWGLELMKPKKMNFVYFLSLKKFKKMSSIPTEQEIMTRVEDFGCVWEDF